MSEAKAVPGRDLNCRTQPSWRPVTTSLNGSWLWSFEITMISLTIILSIRKRKSLGKIMQLRFEVLDVGPGTAPFRGLHTICSSRVSQYTS
ncbi:hypothetical protein BDV29DRAFT_171166 [Aspergillus leporis]|uniref:Uncharacterized protein n=1 Tax=Aspergillus leporis TaxID=41062 RepID=A0A5N5X8L2_9EURO|nr:hypothetical protein BDV29DRAFT_171166 [Aspergillus leporis]